MLTLRRRVRKLKKYFALILGVLFVLSFAGSAFAIHAEIPSETQAVVAKGSTQITLGGEIRVRGEFRQNTTDFNSDSGDHYAAYDQRVRLSIEAKVSPNTMGFIQVEAGDGKGVNNYTWGKENDGAKGVYTKGETKRGQFNIIQAWILHTGSGLLGIPSGLKIGHMPLALGNKLFFDHTLYGDDAIVFFMDPTKELHVGLVHVKFTEASATLNDDSTAYVGLFTYKLGKDMNISGDVSYVDDQLLTMMGATFTGGTHLWNFGLRGDMKVGGLGLKADVEVQSGKAKMTTADVKLRGYAFLAGATYSLNGINLEAAYAYGSGDKSGTADKLELFITGLSQVQNYTYVYDYRTVTAAGATGTGLANTQYIKVGAGTTLAKNLTGKLDLYWLRANKVASGSKSIGTEIDWNIKYQLDRNLVYMIEGGYLIAGGFYDTPTKEADNAYAIRHGITLSF